MIEMKEAENPNPKRKKIKLEDCVPASEMIFMFCIHVDMQKPVNHVQ